MLVVWSFDVGVLMLVVWSFDVGVLMLDDVGLMMLDL